jgi:putative acyl-CoA dehydrogenase
MCLDVLRAARRETATVEALLSELAAVRGSDARLDGHAATLATALRDPGLGEREARRIAGGIATAVAAALLVRHAPAPIADAYCASRLGDGYAGALGVLPSGAEPAAILAPRIAG